MMKKGLCIIRNKRKDLPAGVLCVSVSNGTRMNSICTLRYLQMQKQCGKRLSSHC